MTKFALPSTGAKNVEMQDGSKYIGRGTLKRGRVIEVDRVDHARAIGNQEHIQRMADFAGAQLPTQDNECSSCHHSGWPWQTACPRCGGAMSNPKKEDQ